MQQGKRSEDGNEVRGAILMMEATDG